MTAEKSRRLLLATLLAAALGGCSGGGEATTTPPPGVQPPPSSVPFQVEVFADNLNFPVRLAFAPDGRLFFNELQTGNVRIIQNEVLQAQPFATLPVETSGERGLLGIAFHPQFVSNGFVYLLHSDPSGVQRVVRFADMNGEGVAQQVIIDNLPSTVVHNGGAIGFGPDGRLYVSIGDSQEPANSQDQSSLSGKILRYADDGAVPADNPFGSLNPAFNLGLRNSFDFDFHPATGTIYASENGPNCDDELNRIVRGGNYGWRPNYPCGDADPSFIAPLTRFNPSIAPTGVAFYTSAVFPQFRNQLFLVDFNSGRMRRFAVNESAQGQITETAIVVDGGFGALLDVAQSPDGFIYFSSQTAILRLVPQ